MDDTKKQDETCESSSSSLSHSAQILQAASPYLDQTSKSMLENFVRLSDFMETIQNIRQNGFPGLFPRNRDSTVSMANLGIAAQPIDTEALLTSIRPFCSPREGSIIDQIMNIFRMKRMMSMYQTISNMMNMMNGGSGNEGMPFSMDNAPDMAQMMNMASMMSQMMNSSANQTPSQDDSNKEDNTEEAATPSDSIREPETSYEFHNSNQDTDDTYWNNHNPDYHRNSYGQDVNAAWMNNDSTQTQPETDNNMNEESVNTPISAINSNGSNNNNAQMLNMLSGMIPPEQKDTFEALKLLMESGVLK